MFEFAFEGELLPFIVNGDRIVLFALLPRRKPRTPVSAAAFLCSKNSQPHQLAATPIRLPHLAAGLDFCFVDAGPHLYTMRVIPCLGFTRRKNRGHPAIGMTSVSDFSTRDRLAAVSLPLLPVGAALSRGFSFSALAIAWAVCVFSFGRVTRFARDGRLRFPFPCVARYARGVYVYAPSCGRRVCVCLSR